MRHSQLGAARAAHAAGAFEEARALALPLAAATDAPLEAVRGLAELEYLLGNYAAIRRSVAGASRECGNCWSGI